MSTAVYGVTDAGFYSKPLSQIQSEIDTGLKAILGASAGTNPDGTLRVDSMAGQLKTLLVDSLSAQWDLMQAVYSSLDPNQATGQPLDRIGAITGLVRSALTFSAVTGTLTGVPNTIVPAGSLATVAGTGSQFATLAGGAADPAYPNSTIVAATAWAGTTAYVAGNKVTNGGNIYTCQTGGISAGSGGPTGTGTNINDNGVLWNFAGVGTGSVDVATQAVVSGPITAIQGALSTIATPVNGWKGIYNNSAAVAGTSQELDVSFRNRRAQALAAPGNTTAEAIITNIIQVNQGSTDPNHQPPTACKVFSNSTDSADSVGRPPHSVEVLVQGGTDADIALAVWRSVGAGTPTFGNQTTVITDSQGNSQTVNWSRPVQVPIYVIATAMYDASQWPVSSNSLVAQSVLSALLTYTATPVIGLDVRSSALIAAMLRGPAQTDVNGNAVVPAAAYAPAVPGILEITSLTFGTSPSPGSSTNIVIDARSIATFASANMTITAATETP